jgi:hypothetical protein
MVWVCHRSTEDWTIVWIRPVGVIQRFEGVFEKLLKEVDTGGELHIDVTIIHEDKPWNVGHNEGIFKVTTAMFKVTWEKKFKKYYSCAGR